MPADGPRYRLVIHPIAKADLASIWHRMYRFRRYGQQVDTIAARHFVLPVFSCAALLLRSCILRCFLTEAFYLGLNELSCKPKHSLHGIDT